jgi:hypothetical protein
MAAQRPPHHWLLIVFIHSRVWKSESVFHSRHSREMCCWSSFSPSQQTGPNPRDRARCRLARHRGWSRLLHISLAGKRNDRVESHGEKWHPSRAILVCQRFPIYTRKYASIASHCLAPGPRNPARLQDFVFPKPPLAGPQNSRWRLD